MTIQQLEQLNQGQRNSPRPFGPPLDEGGFYPRVWVFIPRLPL